MARGLLCAGGVYEREERLIQATHAALIRDRWIEPFASSPHDTALWMSCELAARVEHRFSEAAIDPRTIDDEKREWWRRRAAVDGRIEDPHEESWHRRAYWLIDQGVRAGTIALSASATGMGRMSIFGLYVFREHRGRGVASRVFERAYTMLREYGGRSLRLSAPWAWRPAVCFCLSRGMWAVNWKHEMVFEWAKGLPGWEVAEVAGGALTFSVIDGDRRTPLITAARDGPLLAWSEAAALHEQDWEVLHACPGTFAVALAARGWPLIRSADAWAKRRFWSDYGEPEGLARKIEIFEAVDRRYGFEVKTPRIPGIAYPNLEDID